MLDRRPARVTGRQVPPLHLRWGSGSGAIFQRATHRFCGRGVLFLCGYFDSGYLGYEAAEGIDWVWEHRIDDLASFGV